MMNIFKELNVNLYINKEKNYLLIESRVFGSTEFNKDSMLEANLRIVDLTTMKEITGVDDVWEYEWVLL